LLAILFMDQVSLSSQAVNAAFVHYNKPVKALQLFAELENLLL
jgi:hypothetical protein